MEYTLCHKKNGAISLPNVNRFSQFFTARKTMKFAIKNV